MPNPIFNATQMPNIKQLYQMMNSPNAKQMFLSLANQNPNLKPFAQMISNGGNPELIARQLFKDKGINIDEFIKGLMNS